MVHNNLWRTFISTKICYIFIRKFWRIFLNIFKSLLYICQHKVYSGNDYKENRSAVPAESEKTAEVKENTARSDSDGFTDDPYDPMESWADDKPVNWNEKIVFSDEDKPKDTAQHQRRDATRGMYIGIFVFFC